MFLNLNHRVWRQRTRLLPLLAIMLGVLIGLFGTSAVAWADEETNPGNGQQMQARGTLDALPVSGRVGTWQIGGEAYTVVAQTKLKAEHGRFEVGACLKVKYRMSGTERTAKEIRTERHYTCGDDEDPGNEDPGEGDSRYEARLYGVIVSFPAALEGEWNIGGILMSADGSTKFEQKRVPFAEGVVVEVKFYTDEEGNHYIREIESKFAIENHGDDDHNGAHEGREGHAYGLIDAWPSDSTMGPIGQWTIGGIDYIAMPETRFVQRKMDFDIGVQVRVKYRLDAEGNRIARVIRTTGRRAEVGQPVRSTLVSYVEEMPAPQIDADTGEAIDTWIGTWKVGNVMLVATDETHFGERHGLLAVGAFVKVKYYTEDDVNYMVSIETRVPPGFGGHIHRHRIKHMGDDQVAASGAEDSTDEGELWIIGEQQFRILDATDLDETAMPLDVDVLAEVDSYTGDDGIEVATRVRALADEMKIYLPLTMR